MNVMAAQDAPESPLQACDLSKNYGPRRVFTSVSMDVSKGAVLGLIGRNGAGKSTLLRCLLGLSEPSVGEAFVFGEPALRVSDASKQRLAYVPQQPEALAWLEVGDMLDFVGRFYPRWDRNYVDTMLTGWNLPRNQQLAKLSPGERQRVALIRALASRPDLLVLDEPAASLDPVARRDLLRQIVERAGESGTTVVFSTHIVSDLERVASHVAFLHEGKLLLNAPLDDLKERCARILVPADVASQHPGKLNGELSRRRLNDGGIRLVLQRAEGQDWPAIVHAPGVVFDALGLEDLFIEAVE